MINSGRRRMLRLLGGAGSAYLVCRVRKPVESASLAPSPSGQAVNDGVRGAVIRTIVRDVQPEQLGSGAVLFHEHLSVDFQRQTTGGTDDVDFIVALAGRAAASGVSCIVDGGHPDMGRMIETLRQVATCTGVHVVASGGYYTQRTFPADVASKSEDQLADDLVQAAEVQRHGAFGEIGQSPNLTEMTPDERKVFRAVGKAHVRTGLPIFTHNAYGTGSNVPADAGLRQLDTLESVGVSPRKIAIGHTCCLDDPRGYVIKRIAKRGAFVGFDRLTYIQFVSDEKKVGMILALLDAGFGDQLLLSSDFPGWRNAKPWIPTLEQGPGWERTLTVFVPMLRKAGVSESVLKGILETNPRRFLAFVPSRAL
jgi:phosphotriesterase-related protein